jgi:hypothetical protein
MAQANAGSPISDLLHNQLAISRQCADALFAGTERIDRVMRGATHRVLADQLQFAEALATTSDPRSLIQLQSGMLNRPDNVAHYAQEVMQAVAEMQSDISRSMQLYMEQVNGNAMLTARAATHGEPVEKVGAFNPLTGMFSMWQTALKEVAAIADHNLQTARSGLEAATQRTRDSGAAVVEAVHQASAETDGATHRGAGSGKRK